MMIKPLIMVSALAVAGCASTPDFRTQVTPLANGTQIAYSGIHHSPDDSDQAALSYARAACDSEFKRLAVISTQTDNTEPKTQGEKAGTTVGQLAALAIVATQPGTRYRRAEYDYTTKLTFKCDG